ncbi:hypothetical protein ACP275_08G029100 [Erythranthe tilingii]
MDYARWAEMQQNPNSGVPLLHTVNYSAGYSHNLNSDPYQPPAVNPHNALYQPQLQPPGVEPPYVPPAMTVEYAQQPISYQPHQVDAAAIAAHASYYYYQDPNLNWADAFTQIGATNYTPGLTTPNTAIQPQKRNIWKKGPKKPKIVQSAWCEVCGVDCNSKDVLDQHKLGKKHQKNLEKLKGTAATKPGPSAHSPAVLAAHYPTIGAANYTTVGAANYTTVGAANYTTVGSAQYPTVGYAHSPAIGAAPSPAIVDAPSAILDVSTPLPVSVLTQTNNPVIGPEVNPEKPKSSNATILAAPSAILAPSPASVDASTPLPVSAVTQTNNPIIGPEVNPEKPKSFSATIVAAPSSILASSPASVDASTPLSVSALTQTNRPIIGPEENPEKPKSANYKKAKKKAAARTENLETKRRKVLESGAAAETVHACTVCNVVCNSNTVFSHHLAGQRHASMVRKLASSGAASLPC